MEEDTKYKKYLKALERIEAKTQLDKATKKVKDMLSAKAAEKSSFVKRRMELAGCLWSIGDKVQQLRKQLRLLSMERLLQEWQEQVSQLQHT
jgi:predicted nuclease with TOPRIM domain